eukprot:2220449-Pleurochrysis_carterae.AAC.2
MRPRSCACERRRTCTRSGTDARALHAHAGTRTRLHPCERAPAQSHSFVQACATTREDAHFRAHKYLGVTVLVSDARTSLGFTLTSDVFLSPSGTRERRQRHRKYRGAPARRARLRRARTPNTRFR